MANSQSHSPRGLLLLKIAAAYLLVGLLLGLGMSMAHNYVLSPVHVHINLVGWATLGVVGLVYCVLPQLAEGRLPAAHFWLHNLGLPVMMLGLTALLLGYPAAEPVIAAGSLVTVAGLLAFAISLWMYRPQKEPAVQADAPSLA